MSVRIEIAVSCNARLGEGAVWDADDAVLWWADIAAGRIHRFDPATGEDTARDFGEPVGCFARREQGGFIVAAKSGFYLYDWETGARTAISDPEAHLPGNRFNDGTTDRQGRLWAGTMKDGGDPEPLGNFYRVDPDHSVSHWKGGIYTTNGLAFSADGRRMYFSDSNPAVRTIWVCDYDTGTGTPGTPELFFDSHAVAGRPDGATVDADGCYWIAGIGASHVYRFTPDGRLDRTIEMPVERPTKPMFGGPNLDILYVTSLGGELKPDPTQPMDGDLFAITGLGVQGVPQTRFAG